MNPEGWLDWFKMKMQPAVRTELQELPADGSKVIMMLNLVCLWPIDSYDTRDHSKHRRHLDPANNNIVVVVSIVRFGDVYNVKSD